MAKENKREASFEEKTGRDKYFAELEREILELADPATGLLGEQFSCYVTCAICSADTHERLFVKRGYTFVRCRNCGHIYCNPQVRAEVVAETYRHSKANEYWIEVLLNSENQAWQIPYFESALDLMEAHTPRGRVLDVGCSVGLFMEVAQARGWQAVGLELGQKAYNYARGRGLDVRQQSLEEMPSDGESFEAVTAFSLMEHLNDPGSLVRAVRGWLKPGGVFAAISPNTYSLASMILREKMPTFDGRNHLQYYTVDSFRRLFEQNGYTVVHLDTVLTALPNIKKYIQYQDPYSEEAQGEFLPSPLRAFFNGPRNQELESFIYQNHLGLRLRLIAKRAE